MPCHSSKIVDEIEMMMMWCKTEYFAIFLATENPYMQVKIYFAS